MGNLSMVRSNSEAAGRGTVHGRVPRRCMTARGRRIVWGMESLFVLFAVGYCMAMMLFIMIIGLTGGLNHEDVLKWLCYVCFGVAAVASYVVFKRMICHGAARRTILYMQWMGNACIAAVTSAELAVMVGISHMVFADPWLHGVHAKRLEMIAWYRDSLSWAPRYVDELGGVLKTRTGWSYWVIFTVAAFAVLFASTMLGQLVGEICSRLGTARSIVAGLGMFVIVLLLAQILGAEGLDAIDHGLALALGFYQRGSLDTFDWSAAYSLWPLLVTMTLTAALCMAVTALLTTRREVAPAIAR